MKVKVLGAHQLETRDSRLTSFLIDDVLVIDAGSLSSGLSLAEQKAVKAIIITHHHFDHCRDLLTFGLTNRGRTTDVYAAQDVLDSLSANLVNGAIYPNHTEASGPDPPSLRFICLAPSESDKVLDYSVLPLPVPHGPPAYGFQVTGPSGRRFFYTGDTGAGCSDIWVHIQPHLLFIQASYPNRLADDARGHGHLTPELLAGELRKFREQKGYLPAVRAVHINPIYESEIRKEIETVAVSLEVDLTVAHEGLELEV